MEDQWITYAEAARLLSIGKTQIVKLKAKDILVAGPDRGNAFTVSLSSVMACKAQRDLAKSYINCTELPPELMKLALSQCEQGAEIRPIQGYPGYFISNFGDVFSTRRGELVKLKTPLDSHGYPAFEAIDETGKRASSKPRVHRMVCLVFNGEPSEGKTFVLHRNDNPLDNRAENLYWGDNFDNARDKKRNGMLRVGSQHPNAKFTEKEAREIHQLLKQGETCRSIAEKYGVHDSTVHHIKTGKRWKHVFDNT